MRHLVYSSRLSDALSPRQSDSSRRRLSGGVGESIRHPRPPFGVSAGRLRLSRLPLPEWAVLSSWRMGPSRLRRAGVLLLVLWLNADLAAFGFCSGDRLTSVSSSAVMGTAHQQETGAPCCVGHHCFCSLTVVDVARFEFPANRDAEFIAPSLEPAAPESSVPHASPPPRS